MPKKINKVAPPKHRHVRLAEALKHNGLVATKTPTPRLKKDGSPYTPWSEEVDLRLAKKEEKIACGEMLPIGKKCSAFTTGVHGPKRPCDRWAVQGLTVCPMHGGSTKAAKAAAKEFLTNELMPTLRRIVEIRDQNDHMPSALGAATHLANRIMGKPDSTERDKGAGAPVIRIGMLLGGLPKEQNQLAVAVEISPKSDTSDEISLEGDDNTIDADYEVED